MSEIKNRLIKLFLVGALAAIPYTGAYASVTNSHSKTSSNDEAVDPITRRGGGGGGGGGGGRQAAPVRGHARREVRRDVRDERQEDYNDEEYNEEEYSERTQQQGVDRGRPGGRR